MKHRNEVEFEVYGDYALFSDPIMRTGGEKCSYPVPTYEALKGITKHVYWKPTIIWYVDAVRIMEPIQMETKGMRVPKLSNSSKCDLAYYTYLKKCRYQVRAHFEWNENRPDLADDRIEGKHYNIALRCIEMGGRRSIFLGTSECQAYVEPCKFGEGEGAYDNIPEMRFGLAAHGFTYPDEAYSPETQGKLTKNFWIPTMKNGVIEFVRPEECPQKEFARNMKMKHFGRDANNFVGLKEFEEAN